MAQPPPCLFFRSLRMISYPSMHVSESSIRPVRCISVNASKSICVYCSYRCILIQCIQMYFNTIAASEYLPNLDVAPTFVEEID